MNIISQGRLIANPEGELRFKIERGEQIKVYITHL